VSPRLWIYWHAVMWRAISVRPYERVLLGGVAVPGAWVAVEVRAGAGAGAADGVVPSGGFAVAAEVGRCNSKPCAVFQGTSNGLEK
jgi:hypothetical protein